MDSPPIEQTLRAETPTELLLLARIEELKRKLYERGCGCDPFRRPECPEPTLSSPPPLTLSLASYAEVTEEADRGAFRVDARTRGKTSFGVATYITREALLRMEPYREADYLIENHKAVLHKLAKALAEERREREREAAATRARGLGFQLP